MRINEDEEERGAGTMMGSKKKKKKTKGEEHVNIKDKIQFKLNQSRQRHGKIKTKQNNKQAKC